MGRFKTRAFCDLYVRSVNVDDRTRTVVGSSAQSLRLVKEWAVVLSREYNDCPAMPAFTQSYSQRAHNLHFSIRHLVGDHQLFLYSALCS